VTTPLYTLPTPEESRNRQGRSSWGVDQVSA